MAEPVQDGTLEIQFEQLRDLTSTFRLLYEPQVRVIRCWPRVLWPDLRPVPEVAVDLDPDGDPWRPRVEVRITADPPPALNPEHLAGLARSMTWLLGDEWSLTILVNGKAEYNHSGTPCQRKSRLEALRRSMESGTPTTCPPTPQGHC